MFVCDSVSYNIMTFIFFKECPISSIGGHPPEIKSVYQKLGIK